MKSSTDLFESAPIPQAIAKNVIPAICSMLMVLIYNIADTFFVGQTGDALQVAAVSLSTPVFLLFLAVGTLFGIGGTSVISRALGAGNPSYAKNVSAFCFYAALASGVVILLLFAVFMTPILHLVGASSATFPHAKNFLSVVMLSGPFLIMENAIANILRAEGKVKEAMMGMILGNVINILLDPIFILGCKMGITGAAVATDIGNLCGAVYYILFFLRKKSTLSISPRDFRVRDRICTGVLAIGIPASLNDVLMSGSNMVLNRLLAAYGDNALAAMGVAVKVNMIIVLLLLGFGQGLQPLLGYCYGAKRYDRFKAVIRFSLVCSTIAGILLTVLCWFGSGSIVHAFIENEAVYAYGVSFIRALMLSGPFIGILFVLTNALQSVGAAWSSLFLSVSRQGLLFIPLLYLLNHIAGLSGIVYTQPVVDGIAIVLSAVLFQSISKKLFRSDLHPQGGSHTAPHVAVSDVS